MWAVVLFTSIIYHEEKQIAIKTTNYVWLVVFLVGRAEIRYMEGGVEYVSGRTD